MAESVLQRIPVVAGLGNMERVRRVPASFTATLVPERENRYFLHAIAVLVDGEKVGYIAPEIARDLYESLLAWSGPPPTCPGRHGTASDHEWSGVELLLDFSNLSLPRVE